MRIVLGLTAAAIMVSPAVWHEGAHKHEPHPCAHEGDVTTFRGALAICKSGFWQARPLESDVLMEQVAETGQ